MRNEIIINISNDSWFGESLAPYQHLQITQIRALEFNRYILRATNTGISAVINNNGVIIDQISNNSEGEMNGFAHVGLNKSIYSQFGDLGILMLLFLSLLFKLYKKPKRL
jgi:apolipoprotein N-acyltransferase